MHEHNNPTDSIYISVLSNNEEQLPAMLDAYIEGNAVIGGKTDRFGRKAIRRMDFDSIQIRSIAYNPYTYVGKGDSIAVKMHEAPPFPFSFKNEVWQIEGRVLLESVNSTARPNKHKKVNQ